ncbi:MAG: dTDP-4-dehydrorhamnose 3,5-epimerase [Gaiellaceae bacterium]
MIFTETELQGAYVVDLERREDERGFFARAWCADEFAEHGLSTKLVQANLSFNVRRGTVRGMHFQIGLHAEAKLIRCTRGSIYDVVIDLRPESSTYKRWISVQLDAESRRALYAPEGFAHGYQTLAPDTETFYQVSAPYAPEAEGGVRWDDPAFGIEWPDPENAFLSEKDNSWPDFTG